MLPPTAWPAVPGLQIRALSCSAGAIHVEAATTDPQATCPRCGGTSARVHSRYARTLADRPLGVAPLRYRLIVRRFVCRTVDCPQALFAESVPALAGRRARTTATLTAAHTAIGLTAGGEPGSRLARTLAMPTSPDTLLRRVRAADAEPGPPPRYVGLDDWAVAKGRRYGTMVVDLERGRVVALLPGRGGEAVRAWLAANPQVEVVTRDRWAAYASAATATAPQAMQVADRWHLLKNLREAVEGVVARLGPELRAAAAGLTALPTSGHGPTPPPTPPAPPAGIGPAAPAEPIAPQELKRQARRDRRSRVRELRGQGLPVRAIARHMRMSRETVRAILCGPDRPHGGLGRRRPTAVDAHRAEVEAWVAAGGTNTADLYRGLRGEGGAGPGTRPSADSPTISWEARAGLGAGRRRPRGRPRPPSSRRPANCPSSSPARGRRRRERSPRSWTESGGTCPA